MSSRSGRVPVYRPASHALIPLPALVSLLLVAVLGGLPLRAQPGAEQKLVASDPDNSDQFGHAVDVYGDFAVVGAPGDDEEAPNAGAAYIFRYVDGSWTEIQKLTAGVDGDNGDAFGTDVSVERNLIAVGAPFDDGVDNDAGAAYVFEWNGATWEQIEKFGPNSISPSVDGFGTSLDLGISIPDESGPPEETHLAVGAATTGSNADGSVYLFVRVSSMSWSEILNFSESMNCPNFGGHLGSSMAIRGDTLISGAPQDDLSSTTPVNNAGVACKFNRQQIINSWADDGFQAPMPMAGDNYGAAVAVDKLGSEYVVVVGAPHAGATTAGRVFVHDAGGVEEFTVASADDYGKAVAIDGFQIVVGAPKDDIGGQDSGAVFFLDRDEFGDWSPAGMLQASDAANEKQFGAAVAYRHSTLIIGSPEEGTIPGPGAAYIYTSLIFRDGFESGDTSAW